MCICICLFPAFGSSILVRALGIFECRMDGGQSRMLSAVTFGWMCHFNMLLRFHPHCKYRPGDLTTTLILGILSFSVSCLPAASTRNGCGPQVQSEDRRDHPRGFQHAEAYEDVVHDAAGGRVRACCLVEGTARSSCWGGQSSGFLSTWPIFQMLSNMASTIHIHAWHDQRGPRSTFT